MRKVSVQLGDRSYEVLIGENLLGRSSSLLAHCELSGEPIVITNRTVMRLHGERFLRALRGRWRRPVVVAVRDGERHKSLETVRRIYSALFRAGADRRSWIAAFGGGVVGDIAGFVAATFMRGIPFVGVPTTLLAQVDSSVGGKVGVNVPQGKNLIGAFYQPLAVLSDVGTLGTLAPRELAAGLYEVIKCGAIRSEPLLAYLEAHLPDVLACRPRSLERVVQEATSIKAAVVSGDEREGGLRMILNYGHTIGHGLEAATAYRRFKHGEAVGWGMIAALAFGRELGLLDDRASSRLARLIHGVAPLPTLRGISPAAVRAAVRHDKKFRQGSVRMVFLPRLGDAEVRSGIDSRRLDRFLSRFLADPKGFPSVSSPRTAGTARRPAIVTVPGRSANP
jgi:3-dehydroquinate synthase